MRRAQAGFTLVSMIVTLAIFGLVVGISAPNLLGASERMRLRLAAGEVAGAFQIARSYAVRHSANVGVVFEVDGPTVRWTLHRDGDGDGLRSADVERGIDPPAGPGRPLAHLGTSVRFGFPPGRAPRDPGDPRRRLTGLDDPIRFNQSDIASFAPLGTATPGTVYLTDGRHGLAAVRVNGRSGRVRVMLYDAEGDRWFGPG